MVLHFLLSLLPEYKVIHHRKIQEKALGFLSCSESQDIPMWLNA